MTQAEALAEIAALEAKLLSAGGLGRAGISDRALELDYEWIDRRLAKLYRFVRGGPVKIGRYNRDYTAP